ncbi:MAG: S-layer homology domain-containing protein, partial [Oscillospiraceae bacterium]|nr:S-layer homology domain-containing protein [Oscillospiraceae bacterium]
MYRRKTRIAAVILAIALAVSLLPGAALGATLAQTRAADKLYTLGLLTGYGLDSSGKPIMNLDNIPKRTEAVTMLVRFLGKEQFAKALASTYAAPFTDVPTWAAPYVGYAYFSGLTGGVGNGKFGSGNNIGADHYLTFLLRALGYADNTDFKWNSPWTLTDSLGITSGQYGTGSKFTRGDMALTSLNALYQEYNKSGKTLLKALVDAGAVTMEQVLAAELDDALTVGGALPPAVSRPTPA